MAELARRTGSRAIESVGGPAGLPRKLIKAAGDVQRTAVVAAHTVRLDMRITELFAEAEIAQDHLDQGRRRR